MKHKPPLSVQILIGLLLGVLAGLALQAAPDVARTYIKPFGVLFLNLIKMVVVPLVFASITVGTCGLGDAKRWAASAEKPFCSTCAPPRWPSRWVCWRPTSFRWGGGWARWRKNPPEPPGRRSASPTPC